MSCSARRIKLKARTQHALRRTKFGWMPSLLLRPSVETWYGFRPGEDRTFKDNFVSRRANDMGLCSVVTDEYDLLKNALMCGAHLVWHEDQKPVTAR